MKRLFVAIKIEPEKKFFEQLNQIKGSLYRERIKWVEEHNVHITIKFLGETDERKIDDIERELNSIWHLAFSICLKNLGVFGSRYDPRVIWVGIEPYDQLVSLMKSVHSAMVPLGFEPDRQNLVPHLTLGRIKELRDKAKFQKTMEAFRELKSEEMRINEFILYESILKKEGPEYRPLKVIALK